MLFSYSYTTTVQDKNGNLKVRSFQTGPLCKGNTCACGVRMPYGRYKFSARPLRGGCTGWGDNVDPAFILFNVSNIPINLKKLN
ncbi:unnamed protein product [Hermetia illucens]|uniref:Uncharacterized protein n=1 Tax=Hermetia illucens TaxID=343691 RepID=A0A7R8UY05_HERIL|nr:unnamed protein product [Hermetia illucens]